MIFAISMLARMALASGRRVSRNISSSRRLNLDVICFSDQKIFKVPGHGFRTLPGEKTDVTMRPPFSGYTMRKRGVALLRRPNVEPLFLTHPSTPMLRSHYDPWAKTFCGADAVFQHDGAPCQTARTTCPLLGEMLRETLAWPAHSPDLSPNDTALWGFRGSLVAQENPTDATTLRAAIIKTHAKITSEQIKRMIWPFTRRLRLCIAADGGYFAASLRGTV